MFASQVPSPSPSELFTPTPDEATLDEAFYTNISNTQPRSAKRRPSGEFLVFTKMRMAFSTDRVHLIR
jgi:hypothetical protein